MLNLIMLCLMFQEKQDIEYFEQILSLRIIFSRFHQIE